MKYFIEFSPSRNPYDFVQVGPEEGWTGGTYAANALKKFGIKGCAVIVGEPVTLINKEGEDVKVIPVDVFGEDDVEECNEKMAKAFEGNEKFLRGYVQNCGQLVQVWGVENDK